MNCTKSQKQYLITWNEFSKIEMKLSESSKHEMNSVKWNQ